jgi:hypothetical protein
MKTHKLKNSKIPGWEVGDKFVVKDTLTLENDKDDNITGVTKEMLSLKGKILYVKLILTALGVPHIVDSRKNYCWRPEWLDKMEDIHVLPVS